MAVSEEPQKNVVVPEPVLAPTLELAQMPELTPPIHGVEDDGKETAAPGGSKAKTPEEYKVGAWRRRAGYVLGIATSLAVVKLALWSIAELDRIEPPKNPAFQMFAIAKLAGHAAITVALVYYAYQLLRVAERLLVPHWWLKGNYLPTMLGAKDPLASAKSLLKCAVDLTKSVKN